MLDSNIILDWNKAISLFVMILFTCYPRSTVVVAIGRRRRDVNKLVISVIWEVGTSRTRSSDSGSGASWTRRCRLSMSRSSESLSLISDNQLSSVKTLFSVLRERARHACHDLHIDPKGGIKRGEWAASWQMAIRWGFHFTEYVIHH